MILSSYPSIDLHGFDRDYASIMVKEFIQDNYIMGNIHLVVIHGIGGGILRERIYQDLKHNPLVLDYRMDMFNQGQTLITIKKKD